MSTSQSELQKGPRVPVQDRSKARVQKILDATESIVIESGWGAASSHAIAKRAGVPPAGVYHFFPDRYMIYDALVQRYTAKFNEEFENKLAAASIAGWADIIDLVIDEIADFTTRRPSARSLSFSCDGEFGTRWSNLTHSSDLADLLRSLFETHAEVPSHANIDTKFALAAEFIMTGFTHAVAAADPMDMDVVNEMRAGVKAYVASWY